jgi:Xaa-Pro dipeptidase
MIRDGDLVLVDMGAESNCYASDITRTFPANGKFTQKQKDIYLIVLGAQVRVIESMRPGVKWSDMHKIALEIVVDGLTHLDIIIGNPDLISENYLELGACFMPHGIGHFMGKDVHDNSVAYCRKEKTILQEGMVLTVEPGIYFIKSLLVRKKSEPIGRFLNYKKLQDYMDFGGIRIEDNIVITKDGNFNLTTVPKELDAIEKIMNIDPSENSDPSEHSD